MVCLLKGAIVPGTLETLASLRVSDSLMRSTGFFGLRDCQPRVAGNSDLPFPTPTHLIFVNAECVIGVGEQLERVAAPGRHVADVEGEPQPGHLLEECEHGFRAPDGCAKRAGEIVAIPSLTAPGDRRGRAQAFHGVAFTGSTQVRRECVGEPSSAERRGGPGAALDSMTVPDYGPRPSGLTTGWRTQL